MSRSSGSIQFTRSIAQSPIESAVRHALHRSMGLIAAGLATGIVPIASAAPFPAVFPLANLNPGAGGNGSQGFVLPGIREYDLAGYSASAAGDVNGDGIDDLIA